MDIKNTVHIKKSDRCRIVINNVGIIQLVIIIIMNINFHEFFSNIYIVKNLLRFESKIIRSCFFNEFVVLIQDFNPLFIILKKN